MLNGIATTRCGMSTSTSTLQAIRTLTMPMSIPTGRQRAFSQMIRFGTPIPTQGCLKVNSGAGFGELNTAQREHPLDVVCKRAQTPAN